MNEIKPYPLQFDPVLMERVWGGRALEQFGFSLPEGPIGEAWVVGDHPNGTTKVINGPLAGKGLDEIRDVFGTAWLGSKGISAKTGRFPLLLKLLDSQDDLSVQVHPSDDYEQLAAEELGKTEMWYILDAKPGAKIIYGLRPGLDRESFKQLIEEDRIMEGLCEVPVSAGDAFYIPAGTVHALCSGVLVVEVQQNSDTTYRLYDYNRPGLDGKPRELHIEDSLNVIAYDNAGADRRTTEVRQPNEWLEIARSPYFVVEKTIVEGQLSVPSVSDSFTLLVVCNGKGTLSWAGGELALREGTNLLLPSGLAEVKLAGPLTVLRSFLP